MHKLQTFDDDQPAMDEPYINADVSFIVALCLFIIGICFVYMLTNFCVCTSHMRIKRLCGSYCCPCSFCIGVFFVAYSYNLILY